ncbi:MAG: hypothetical protein MJ200_01960 [Mycoplasmoidaceae bacterium]|nr:hypothetical protein [Mycoplasmoidaceae bacterium]
MDITMKHIFAASNVGLVKTENNVIKTTMMPRCFFNEGLAYQYNRLRYFGARLGFKNFQEHKICNP